MAAAARPPASPPAGGTVAVIGEEVLVRGFGLAGALVLPAAEPVAVRAAWDGLPAGVALVVLTAAAAAALAGQDPGDLLVAVLP
jgi:vacuolar-type H+-ATPase subunit F/Vma7